MDIFVPIRFKTSIQLAPSELLMNFEDVILHKIRTSLEGVCSRYGYIRPNSIVIVKRSVGSFVKQHFNGHIKFEMICKAEVCNPAVGSVFEAVVKNKNALGVHAESTLVINNKEEPVLDIIIPKRSVGIVSTIDLEALEIGDRIFIEVLGKRYQLNDKKISIIGKAIREPPKDGHDTGVYEDEVDNVPEEEEALPIMEDLEDIESGEESDDSETSSDEEDDEVERERDNDDDTVENDVEEELIDEEFDEELEGGSDVDDDDISYSEYE
jgi:DNA-directed RNA polymerase subunit E'/Rpb7